MSTLPSPFSGLYTALITPFTQTGALDETGLLKLLDRQMHARVNGVILLGSTGESSTLSHAEENRILSLAVGHVNGHLPLFAGIHAPSTQVACERAAEVKELGVDGILALTPSYIRPTQEGLQLHFEALLRATTLPTILYNVPHRTGCHLELETLKKLVSFPHLIGLKECSGNLPHIASSAQYMRTHHPKFSLMSGDDAGALPMIALGARGLISVTSNLFPSVLHQLVVLCLKGDFHAALILHDQLFPLFQALFCETNPIPIKEAMDFFKLPSGKCRLPLTPMKTPVKEQLHAILNHTLTLVKSLQHV